MRAAFRFSKGGAARYISHLDLMRAMNRAIRRAGLPAVYSQGFHPHIVMSFAQALGLGYFSAAEYMEISLPEDCALQPAMEKLNSALPGGLAMSGAWPIPEGLPTLMASVTAARWRVELAGPDAGGLLAQFPALLQRDAIEVEKGGRSGAAIVEIRRGIHDIALSDGCVELMLSAGSALNIRPELVVKAALGSVDRIYAMTRLELYAMNHGRHTPFHQIFTDGDRNECTKDDTGGCEPLSNTGGAAGKR
jgi:radical SAM-linked protein